MLISQEMRRLAPELDPLRLGTGWSLEDLSKSQIFVESTFGDSHPGSGHLDKLVEAACRGIADAGGHEARYFCTDMCDGESQGTDGINFSLAIPDLIEYAYEAGKQSAALALKGLSPGDIVTMDSLGNAIMVHAAISGSTNNLLHLPTIAHEYGLEIDGDTFVPMTRPSAQMVLLPFSKEILPLRARLLSILPALRK